LWQWSGGGGSFSAGGIGGTGAVATGTITGFYNENGSLVATRLEKQGTLSLGVSEVELKGTITGFNDSDTFTLDGITVTFDGTTALSDVPGGVIEDGQFVEVKGTLVTTTAINATRIELEDEGIEDSADTVSLEGFVSDFVNTGNFRVSGQRVNAAAAGFSPAGLADINVGDFLEIEGYIDGGGNIVASQLQRDEPGRIELRGPVDVPPAAGDDLSGSVSILGITIRTDESTDFEDQFDSDISGSLFFIQVSDDDLVEYHDEQADGIAEEVEFQD
jgi:hypothetical protein